MVNDVELAATMDSASSANVANAPLLGHVTVVCANCHLLLKSKAKVFHNVLNGEQAGTDYSAHADSSAHVKATRGRPKKARLFIGEEPFSASPSSIPPPSMGGDNKEIMS